MLSSRVGKASIAAGALALCATLAVSTASSANSRTASAKPPIIIGAAVAASGFMTSYDDPDMDGFKLEMNAVNAAGGVDGRKIKLITSDSASTPAGAQTAAQDLISKGAQILLVTANYDVGAPAGLVAEQHHILNVSIGAASPKYGVQGVGPLAYTVAPATYEEGAEIAQFFKQQGWNNTFALDDTSLDYSTQVCQGFMDREKQLGITPGQATFLNSDTSLASQITAIQAAKPQAIALCSYTPGGATAVRLLRAAGINVPLAGGIGMAGTYWLTAVPNLSNFYTASSASMYGGPNKAVNAFVAKYIKAYGARPSTDAAIGGYAAGQMIFDAIKEAGGSTNGPKLAAELNKFRNKPLLSGPTTYTSTLHIPVKRPLVIIKYTDGHPKYLETLPLKVPVNLHL